MSLSETKKDGYFAFIFAPDMKKKEIVWNQLTATLGRSGTKISKRDDFLGVGTYKTISREHAKIKWNAKMQCFDLEVLGKRGIYSNSKKVEKNGLVHLSNDCPTPIKMGESRMYFCPSIALQSGDNSVSDLSSKDDA